MTYKPKNLQQAHQYIDEFLGDLYEDIEARIKILRNYDRNPQFKRQDEFNLLEGLLDFLEPFKPESSDSSCIMKVELKGKWPGGDETPIQNLSFEKGKIV